MKKESNYELFSKADRFDFKKHKEDKRLKNRLDLCIACDIMHGVDVFSDSYDTTSLCAMGCECPHIMEIVNFAKGE